MDQDNATQKELNVLLAEQNIRMVAADAMAILAAHLLALHAEMDNLSDNEVAKISTCLLTVMPVFKALTVFRA